MATRSTKHSRQRRDSRRTNVRTLAIEALESRAVFAVSSFPVLDFDCGHCFERANFSDHSFDKPSFERVALPRNNDDYFQSPPPRQFDHFEAAGESNFRGDAERPPQVTITLLSVSFGMFGRDRSAFLLIDTRNSDDTDVSIPPPRPQAEGEYSPPPVRPQSSPVLDEPRQSSLLDRALPTMQSSFSSALSLSTLPVAMDAGTGSLSQTLDAPRTSNALSSAPLAPAPLNSRTQDGELRGASALSIEKPLWIDLSATRSFTDHAIGPIAFETSNSHVERMATTNSNELASGRLVTEQRSLYGSDGRLTSKLIGEGGLIENDYRAGQSLSTTGKLTAIRIVDGRLVRIDSGASGMMRQRSVNSSSLPLEDGSHAVDSTDGGVVQLALSNRYDGNILAGGWQTEDISVRFSKWRTVDVDTGVGTFRSFELAAGEERITSDHQAVETVQYADQPSGNETVSANGEQSHANAAIPLVTLLAAFVMRRRLKSVATPIVGLRVSKKSALRRVFESVTKWWRS